MILEMKVPSPGESITEVEIAQWLVADGDYVEKDQAIAEVDSDKATLELPAEVGGTITLKAEEGDAVAVGQVVCLIDTEGAPKEGQSTPSPTEAPAAVTAAPPSAPVANQNYAAGSPSPAAKKIIAEKGMDLESIVGTGRNGRITKEDAVKAVPAMGTAPAGSKRGEERKKLSLLRRKVAERLVAVKNETAMLTTFNEADMKPIFALRKQYKETFTEKHEVNLGFMSFFTKAVVRALKMYPNVNSMIDGDYKIIYDYCDIMEPKTPPLEMVKVPPVMSSTVICPSLARMASRLISCSISLKDKFSAPLTTGTINPFGPETATQMSQ